MKTSKSIITVIFVLLTAQITSAYYCPSTGRWLSRDPVGERGFQALMAAAQAPIAAKSSRWITRDPSPEIVLKPSGPEPIFPASYGPNKTDLEAKSHYNDLKMTRSEYRFVDNDPIILVDARGEDIYLAQGNPTAYPFQLNRWVHMGVCVDTYQGSEKSGKLCFTFEWTGVHYKLPSIYWLGWPTTVDIGGPCVGWGRIDQEDYVNTHMVDSVSTTQKQDVTWLGYMLNQRVGTKDHYTVDFYNCILYSALEFADAPNHMGPP
jgi:hypothetical protein